MNPKIGTRQDEPKPRGQKPLCRRINPDDLQRTLDLIASGRCMSEAAFAQIGVCRESLNHALTRGRDVARRVEAGEAVRSDDRDCLEFYLKVNRARGSLRQRLHERAVGIVDVSPAGAPVFDPNAESTNAMKILNLLDPELRAPTYDPQELEAIRAAAQARTGGQPPDAPEPPPTDPTPAQAEAYLRREADRLGFTLTPKPADE